MALIEWRDEFSLGVPEVDHEHRALIDLINTAYERLGQQDSAAAVAAFLGEIYAKISAHFALEEHLMRERRYDHYDEHKADHERLLDEIRAIMDDYEDEIDFSERLIADRLERWFTVHFRTQDARLHQYLDKQGR